MSLAFLGGIHGAGKGEFAGNLSQRVKLAHLSAGKVIQETRRAEESGKRVADVAGNQALLVAELEKRGYRSKNVLLDGHFAVLGRDGTPKLLPLSVFRILDPQCLLVLTIDPREARKRLLRRDGQAPEVVVLSALQEAEIRGARATARKLRKPLLILTSPSIDEAEAFLNDNLEQDHHADPSRH